MTTRGSERELVKLQREKRKEEELRKKEREKRLKEKKESEKHIQDEIRKERNELRKQRESVEKERRALKERSKLMIQMEENRKEKERLDKEMTEQVSQSETIANTVIDRDYQSGEGEDEGSEQDEIAELDNNDNESDVENELERRTENDVAERSHRESTHSSEREKSRKHEQLKRDADRSNRSREIDNSKRQAAIDSESSDDLDMNFDKTQESVRAKEHIRQQKNQNQSTEEKQVFANRSMNNKLSGESSENDSETDRSEDLFEEWATVGQIEDADEEYLSSPRHNSTEVEDEVKYDLKDEDELEWLDGKYNRYIIENRELETSLHQLLNEQCEAEYKYSHRKQESGPQMSRKMRKSERQYESSDEEDKIREKIKQLKLTEKKMNEVIERNKLLRHKIEELKKKESQRKERQKLIERERVKVDRLRKLKEEEKLLRKGIKEKERSITDIEKNSEQVKVKPKDRKLKTAVTIECEQKSSDRQVPVKDRKVKIVKKIESDKEVEQKSSDRQVPVKLHRPKIPPLTEDSFEDWKIEVEILIKSGLYDENLLCQSVRGSLVGHARKILRTMDVDSTTREIVDKLESVYGNVTSGEAVLAEFYLAKQRKDECVADWGVRIEGILQKAQEKGHVIESQREDMLKTRFWRKLYNDGLKNATRSYFDTCKTFEELRRKVRMEENEILTEEETYVERVEKPSVNIQTGSDDKDTVMKVMLERMKSLEDELRDLKERNRYDKDGARNRDYNSYSQRGRSDRREQMRRDRYDRWSNKGYRDNRRDFRDRNTYDRDYPYREGRGDRNRPSRDQYDRYTDRYERRDDWYRGDDKYNRSHSRDRYHGRGYRYDDRYGYDREVLYHDSDNRRQWNRRNNDRDGYRDDRKQPDRRESERRDSERNRDERQRSTDNGRDRSDDKRRDKKDSREQTDAKPKDAADQQKSGLNSKASLSGGR